LLNKWRGRTRKQFWWTWKEMILVKKGIQYQRNGVKLDSLSIYNVADAQKIEWEYRKNQVVHESKYPNLKAMKEVVKLW
jgi:hypothetical protein